MALGWAAVLVAVLALLALVLLAVFWFRRARLEGFEVAAPPAYAEDLSGLPPGLATYLSVYSDPSVQSALQHGPWRDLVGAHDFRADGGLVPPLGADPAGLDLAGVSLTGPPSVDLVPGRDFTLAWAARDDPAGAEDPAVLFKLWGNSANNNGVQVTVGPRGVGVLQVAVAVGAGAVGVWQVPAAVDLRRFAVVCHGPALSLFVEGAKVDPVVEGAVDPALLMSNKPAQLNPGGGWTGRLAAVAVWPRALQDFEAGVAAAWMRAQATGLPRAEAAHKAEVATLVQALAPPPPALPAGAEAGAVAAKAAALHLRESFVAEEHARVLEAAKDAVALVNGGADVVVEH